MIGIIVSTDGWNKQFQGWQTMWTMGGSEADVNWYGATDTTACTHTDIDIWPRLIGSFFS